MNYNNQLAAFGLFAAKAPRYTSYPTAPHFTTGVQKRQFEGWLGAVSPTAQVSMYIHIPFCRRLCWFCACRTQGVHNDDPVISYLKTLRAEIKMVADAMPKGVTLSRLHWGGGSPTLLPAEQIELLAGFIANLLPFAPGAEFSVEIDPSEVDDRRMDALAAAGMNRASIGVQDFNPDIQKAIGREQSFEITRDTAKKLRARGIHSLNTDILYGLPFQDIDRIRDTTEKLLSLEPDRVALYGYAHVPWMARRQKMIPEDKLPVAAARLDLYNAARDLFLQSGYDAIGIDHFAKPGDGLGAAARSGTLRRNFQGYTDDDSDVLIGMGASAISRLPQGYVQNVSATAAYLGQVRSGNLASARGHEFSAEDKVRGRVIERLMCDFRVDPQDIEAEFGDLSFDLGAEISAAAKKYHPFATVSEGVLQLSDTGRPLARMVAHEFDTYVMNENGHSLAI